MASHQFHLKCKVNILYRITLQYIYLGIKTNKKGRIYTKLTIKVNKDEIGLDNTICLWINT